MDNEGRLSAIQARLVDFKEERPVLAEQDHNIFFLFLLLMGEVHELGQEMAKDNMEEVEKELADCLIFLLNIAAEYGIDVHNAVMTKIDRNVAKYPAELFAGEMEYHGGWQIKIYKEFMQKQ